MRRQAENLGCAPLNPQRVSCPSPPSSPYTAPGVAIHPSPSSCRALEGSGDQGAGGQELKAHSQPWQAAWLQGIQLLCPVSS